MNIKIKDSVLQDAARDGVDAFLDAVLSAFKSQVGEHSSGVSRKFSQRYFTMDGLSISRIAPPME